MHVSKRTLPNPAARLEYAARVSSSSGPLAGLKVVQLVSMAPAPFGCMVLADLGADVIRVERAGSSAGIAVPPGYFDRGQQSIAVNLKDPRGVQLVLDLLADADVLVEGFRPGVAERLGLGPGECLDRNPGLVYARLTGYGQEGTLAQAAGHDINYLAMSGALSLFGHAGERPVAPVNLLADFAGGGFLMVIGILAALQERTRSGLGQVVDAAMVDGVALFSTFIHAMSQNGLWRDGRGRNLLDSGAAFYDTYECADGEYVAVGALEARFYATLLEKLGLADAELPDPFDLDSADQLRAALSEAFATKTRDEWGTIFDGVDACVTPVLSISEAERHPYAASRDLFVEVDGKLIPAPAPRFSRTPAGVPEPAPEPGEHAELLLKGVGKSDAEIADLRAAGVIG